MRPHWQFVLLSILIVASVVFVAGVAIYVVSLVAYLTQLSGGGYAAQFGLRGLGPVITAVPWRIALLALVVLGVLHILVKRFAFAYQKPFVYTIVGVTGLVVASSFAVAQTTAHERMHQVASERDVPALREIYAERGDARHLHFGRLTIGDTRDEYTLTKLDGSAVTVRVSERTRQPADLDLTVPMVVLGAARNGVIEARGIRPAPDVRERLRDRVENQRSIQPAELRRTITQ